MCFSVVYVQCNRLKYIIFIQLILYEFINSIYYAAAISPKFFVL
jgi:hypothetical protein